MADSLAKSVARDIRRLSFELDSDRFKVSVTHCDEVALVLDGSLWNCPRLCCTLPAVLYDEATTLEVELLYLPFICDEDDDCPRREKRKRTRDELTSNTSSTCSPELRPSRGEADSCVRLPPAIRAEVDVVVRLRVLSAIYHPLVDPDTQVFQQELARVCVSAVGQVKNVDGDDACSLLQLLRWSLEGKKMLGDLCVVAPTLDEVQQMWRDHDEVHEHQNGCCEASLFPVAYNSLLAADEASSRSLLEEAKSRLFQMRRDHVQSFSTQLFARGLMVQEALGRYASLQKDKRLFLSHSHNFFDGEVALQCLLDDRLQKFLTAFRGQLPSQIAGTLFRSEFCTWDLEGVASFSLLSAHGCEVLSQEIRNVESFSQDIIPRVRPNSMNNSGLIVNDIGMRPLMTYLCREVLFPIATILLPQHTCDNTLDDHHSFVVEYGGTGGDTSLDMHSDDSEVTFNVNLVDTFKGSSLRFCGMPGTESHRQHRRSYEHALGRAVVHAGAMRHGAVPIESGERMNLILWCRSSWSRQQFGRPQRFFDSHEGAPDVVCLSRSHDHDYDSWISTRPVDPKQ